jgi:phospholipid/cholesterol/gamma-HCH transport system permease protein
MVCYEKFFKEIDDLIIDSLGIVAFISFFVGKVAIQTALNLRIH